MPAFSWPIDPSPPISDFEQRHANAEAGALLQWARLSVEALYYLDDIDAAFGVTLLVPGQKTQVVELAHARWATGTCITALDLTAAALGRALGRHTGDRELDLRSFVTTAREPSRAGLAARSDAVSGDAVDRRCAERSVVRRLAQCSSCTRAPQTTAAPYRGSWAAEEA